MITFTRLYEEYSSGTFLVLSVAVAREEVRLPERKKACVRFNNAKRTRWKPFVLFHASGHALSHAVRIESSCSYPLFICPDTERAPSALRIL